LTSRIVLTHSGAVRKDHEHLGLAELAIKLGVSRSRAHQLMRAYADFPRAVAILTMGQVWHADDVEHWLTMHPVRPTGVRRG